MKLALKLLRYDLRSGRLGLLAAALVVAVAAVTAVGWLAERVATATSDRAADIIAADRLVRTEQPVPEAWVAEAEAHGLATARVVEFPSVAVAGQRTRLVSFKAVEDGYPLRGELRTASAPGAPAQAAAGRPAPGTAWVEPGLLTLLDLEVGGTLTLGRQALTVERVVVSEPDRAAIFTSLAPRVLVAWEDVEGSGLVRPGSRVGYSLLLAGPTRGLDGFQAWLEDAPGPDFTVTTGEDAQPVVQEAVRQAERFLGLAALITVVVAAAAILLTARHYAAAQLDRIAVLRVLGASQGRILRLQVAILVAVAVAAGLVGAAAGFAVHWAMLAAVRDLLPPEMAAPTPWPGLSGLLLAVTAAAGFALPTAARLRHVPPMRVLRRTAGGNVLRGAGPLAVAGAVIAGLMAVQAGDALLAAVVIGAVVFTVAALAAAAAAVVVMARWLRRRSGVHRLWLTGVTRRPAATVVQATAVGLGLMALLLLSAVREDLLNTWQSAIPDDAPDTFLINVQEDEVAPLRELLEREAGAAPDVYPLVQGQLTEIGGVPVDPRRYDSLRTQRLVARDFNLTWAAEPPGDNRVVAGRWWNSEPGAEWSVEREIAERIGIELGDELVFIIDGEPVRGTVTSLREVRWDSFNPNFFVIAAPGLIDDAFPEYVTSFRSGGDGDRLLPLLVERFPGVTPVDVGMLLDTVRRIVAQGARVVELMAGLTLAAGVVVLLAALRTAAVERRFEASLMRALGVSRRRLEAIALAELAATGALAGTLAGGAAAAAGYFAARDLFDMAYYAFPLHVVVLGAGVGATVTAAAGWLGARRDWRTGPMALLRAGEG